MEDDGPLSPGTAWGIEALWLAEARNWPPYRAFDHVLLRYLDQGDFRPLLCLLQHGKIPGGGVLRCLAAMIDPEFRARFPNASFPYEIRFEVSRKRGRPKGYTSGITSAVVVYWVFNAGVTAMKDGHRPVDLFWKQLADALDHDAYRQARGEAFPLKAKLVRTDGVKGRHRHPELGMRDRALAWSMSEAIKQGTNYEKALDDVASQCNVSRELVRNAYSNHRSESAF